LKSSAKLLDTTIQRINKKTGEDKCEFVGYVRSLFWALNNEIKDQVRETIIHIGQMVKGIFSKNM
jgi:hypothetical protein